ncbi:unnamed protein product [Cladocopium goreaui]|uniref:Carbohydrate-binding domain-containing protein n=1 Tax=Cladocopium goreaui TaxID=2562237 RepID=A0A9P1BI90_9DINO|nr:unnamed protein product [Cladocopium goreaui]
MVKAWLRATAALSAALALQGALRGRLGRAAAAAGLTAVLLAWSAKPRRARIPQLPRRYPKQYVARKATVVPIDGDLTKAVWQLAPWSDPFVEIRGEDAPKGTKPSQWETTRVKMLWDDEYLYIAAMMDVDAGNELVAKFKERNSPIFHTDSDFEVFLDPAGCCHGYKELEINALNTVWNLLLTRPYMDGGGEVSGRVAKEGEKSYWDVRKQQTAVKVTKGQIGNPTSPSQWCVEIALAHSESLGDAPVKAAEPFVGHCWRINFSRVEKQGQVNWVWSPQVVWSPGDGRYVGQVNMHLPDAWGHLIFANEAGQLLDGSDAQDFVDPTFAARHACACVYYACRAFHEANGRFPSSYQELGNLPCEMETVELRPRPDGYVAQVSAAGRTMQVNHLRLMTIV